MSRRILVVEDDDDIRESIAEVLEGFGFSVDVAKNGADALAQLHAMLVLPDVIFLDLMMPVKDGFQFRAEQRADARFGMIPIVVMSADPTLDTRRSELAARAYVRKPIDLRLLLAAAAIGT
jgi:CheY-like chemotaxis protein